jgi:hypothetical protein
MGKRTPTNNQAAGNTNRDFHEKENAMPPSCWPRTRNLPFKPKKERKGQLN